MVEMMQTISDRRKNALPIGLSCMSDIYVSHAKNAEIWDVEGKRYIDFATGTSTMNVGHSHPLVVDALHKQVDAFTHTFFQQLPYESYVSLCERLNNLRRSKHKQKTMLCTDGAGSVENAIKLAKAYTKRNAVVAFHGGFHGRTHYTSTLAGKVSYKTGAPANEVYHLPFPSSIDDVSLEDTINAFNSLVKHVVAATNIAAIIIEPIQGECGFRVAPLELMLWLRWTCTQNGIVLIADEVQTGFGRTGKMFAMNHFSVESDITCMSKSIAAGIPMSAITGRADIMDSLEAGGLGGTYNGNPLGCVAAHAVLDIIDDELCDRAMQLGERLRSFLEVIRYHDSRIMDIRGLGSMIALQLDDIATVKKIQQMARDEGLILISGGLDGNVIRFLYPLTIEDDTFNEGLNILKKVLNATQS